MCRFLVYRRRLDQIDEEVHADAAAGRSVYAIRMDAYAGRIASKGRRILLVPNEKTNLMRISKPEIDLLMKNLKIGSKLRDQSNL